MAGFLKGSECLASRLSYCIEDGEAETLMKPERLEPPRAEVEVVADILGGRVVLKVKTKEPIRG
jgi:hypothetical protein